MKLKTETFDALLCEETVDLCSERLSAFFKLLKFPTKDISRFTLTVEEILLHSLENGGRDAPVRLTWGTRFRRPYFMLEIDGKPYNAFAAKKEKQSLLGASILKNLGLSPDYSYNGATNTYVFRVEGKGLNPFIPLIVALAAAAVIGFSGRLLPADMREFIGGNLLTPLRDTFFNILGCIAGPMIFLSVAWGIYGIGDAATLKHIGKRLILGYVGWVFLSTILVGCLAAPFFDLPMGSGIGGAGDTFSLLQLLLDIIPQNIFSPFVEGNTLQIIFLAIVIGIAMLFLEQKTAAIARAVEQINYLVQFLTGFISKLVPFFIFITLVDIIWSDTLKQFLSVGKFFILFLCGTLIFTIVLIGYTSVKNRVRPWLLISKGLSTFLIALTTASSAAAFGTNMSTCRTRYGIDDKISSFGVPLGIVIFKPATAIAFTLAGFFYAEACGLAPDTQITLMWYISIIVTAAILAIATPPIPGGALAAYTALFLSAGIPLETALPVALACDTLVDFLTTGVDQFQIGIALLNQASRLGLVDEKILRSRTTAK